MPDEARLREQARAVVQNGKLPAMIPALDADLRQDVRARLSKRELFAATGISSIRRGTGRRCLVCGLPIQFPTLEREVEGPGIVGLAHPDCYALWREESALLRQPPPRRWSTTGSARAW
jgi:hypothetical protein